MFFIFYAGLKDFCLSEDEEETLVMYESRLAEDGNQVLSVVKGYRCLMKKDWLQALGFFQQGRYW